MFEILHIPILWTFTQYVDEFLSDKKINKLEDAYILFILKPVKINL